uniref:Uncharacterized protein n=1 Tax=Aegilops tauschii subsp. strangulata TaxID=200361 RepID=A0A453L3E9_AEGTS
HKMSRIASRKTNEPRCCGRTSSCGSWSRGQEGARSTAAPAEAQHQVERRLLLDVVVGQRAALLQLLPGEDQPLLVRRYTFLVLDLGLDIVDGVAALDLEGDGLPGQGLDKDLH